MALNFSYKDVKPYDGMFVKGRSNAFGGYTPDPKGPDEFINPVMNSIIWGLMTIGVGEITEKNVADVYARFRLADRLFGPPLHRSLKASEKPKKGETYDATNHVSISYTIDDIVRHIGLKTNVSQESQVKWRARIIKRWMSDHENAANAQLTKPSAK